ncbi:GGDEF domain-containing response regulator [Calditrichota bacterium GD2]
MPKTSLPQQVILFKSSHPEQKVLKECLEKWKIKYLEAEVFAKIPNPQIIENTPCAIAIIEDEKGVEFLRSIMHFFPWTQRIMLAEKPGVSLLETAINRAHVNYFIKLPLSEESLKKYLIKANRRFNAYMLPLHKFQALSDVTKDLIEDNLRFKMEAEKDALTGLLNRRSFNIYMENFWLSFFKNQELFALAMLDIDHFKLVNDRYGHPVGDIVLKNFGKVLQENLRKSQDFAFRIGGEEFALLSKGLTKEFMASYVERILNIVRALKISADSHLVTFTFSAGVADARQVNAPQELVHIADNALYQAKNGGRNRIVIYNKTLQRPQKMQQPSK